MDDAPPLDATIAADVATLRMQRPSARNALSPVLVAALRQAIQRLEADPAVRAILLMGSSGGVFSSGIDLRAALAFDRERAASYFEEVATLLWEVRSCSKVTVAVVQGAALGAGADLAAACDLRIASPGASFAFPGLAFGLVLGTRRLAQLVGPARARSLALTGRRVAAPEALAMGLLDEIADDPESTAEAVARAAASRPARAVAIVKELTALEGDLSEELRALRASLADPEFLPRLRAYATLRLGHGRSTPVTTALPPEGAEGDAF